MLHLCIILLSISFSLGAMEQPEQQSPQKAPTTGEVDYYQPLSLAHSAARKIVQLLPRFYQAIPKTLCQQIREDFIYPALQTMLKTKLAGTKKGYRRVTNPRLDSDCCFNHDGSKIINIHRTNNLIEVYSFFDLLKKKLKCKNSLHTIDSPLICCNSSNDTVYVLERRAMDPDEIESEEFEPYRIVKYNAASLQHPLSQREIPNIRERIETLFPAAGNSGVFALSQNDLNAPTRLHFISDEGIAKTLTEAAPPFSITHVHDLHNDHYLHSNHIAIIYRDGRLGILNRYTKRIIYELSVPRDLTDNNALYVISSAISSSKTKIAVGLNNGNLLLYDLSTKSAEKMIGLLESPFSALCFYDNDHLLSAHNNDFLIEREKTVYINLWDLKHNELIATTTQKEKRCCNTLDLCPDKKYLAIGMGYYDVAFQAMESFDFDPDQLDPEKMFKKPGPLLALLDKKMHRGTRPLTVPEKMAFMHAYLKDK